MVIIFRSALLVAGIVLLYAGGNFLVKGACALALRLRIEPLVVGLTIVAFGTSAPELFVSMFSALRGLSGISLGNIVGSNIINIALVLGLSACIAAINVGRNTVFRDIPLMFFSYVLLLFFVIPLPWENLELNEGRIFRVEGLIMVLAISAYLFCLYRAGRTGAATEIAEAGEVTEAENNALADRPLVFLLFLIIVGVIILALGSELLVREATWMALNIFNASERFIGVSIVALGTSLPELMTSIIAATKKQMDISVGNIVGSNMFNCLMVLGLTSLVQPLSVSVRGFSIDIIIMFGISLLFFLMVLRRKKLERWSGAVFLLCYVAYFVYLLQTKSV